MRFADPYSDPETGVLYNRLGIASAGQLQRIEADISFVALADLSTRMLPGAYDLPHLCVFHGEIFGDIYSWAGEIRTVNIAKTDLFCTHQYIATYAGEVFGELAKENYLRDLDRSSFLDRLSHYFGEVNAIHPFREGNGRAQRAFFHQLCRNAGRPINWTNLDSVHNIEASAASLRGDNKPLRRMLSGLVMP
jgi:cell filamentation protein